MWRPEVFVEKSAVNMCFLQLLLHFTVLRQDLSLSRFAGLAGQKALDSLGLQPHIPGFAWAQGV